MNNPWKDLPNEPPYVLPDEKEAILAFNQSAKESYQFRSDLLPEPYLGNPEAEIILLNLNPSFSEHDAAFYTQNAVNISRKNCPEAFPLIEKTLRQ